MELFKIVVTYTHTTNYKINKLKYSKRVMRENLTLNFTQKCASNDHGLLN